MVQLLQRYNKTRSENRDVTIDRPSSASASPANAAVPHLLSCLNMLKQSRGKRQLHAQVIKMTGKKTKKRNM